MSEQELKHECGTMGPNVEPGDESAAVEWNIRPIEEQLWDAFQSLVHQGGDATKSPATIMEQVNVSITCSSGG